MIIFKILNFYKHFLYIVKDINDQNLCIDVKSLIDGVIYTKGYPIEKGGAI